ncbi:Hypothetical predicted protein, partial [Paramuricea clavata]
PTAHQPYESVAMITSPAEAITWSSVSDSFVLLISTFARTSLLGIQMFYFEDMIWNNTALLISDQVGMVGGSSLKGYYRDQYDVYHGDISGLTGSSSRYKIQNVTQNHCMLSYTHQWPRSSDTLYFLH